MSSYDFRDNPMPGEILRREISGERVIIVYPILFGRARLGLADLDDCAFSKVY